MALITSKDRVAVAAAIAAAERSTNAEIVTVLAAASDDYRFVGLAWGTMTALAVGALAFLAGANPVWIITTQLVALCALLALFHFTQLAARFAPPGLQQYRAKSLARQQFLEQGLHHTHDHTGFLIFVSEAEHYVEIIADSGIAIANARWEEIVAAFIEAVRDGRAVAGLIAAIQQCGIILAEVVPKTPENTNELDDRLVLIGYRLDPLPEVPQQPGAEGQSD